MVVAVPGKRCLASRTRRTANTTDMLTEAGHTFMARSAGGRANLCDQRSDLHKVCISSPSDPHYGPASLCRSARRLQEPKRLTSAWSSYLRVQATACTDMKLHERHLACRVYSGPKSREFVALLVPTGE